MATTVEFRTVPLPSPSMTTQVSQTPTSSPSLPFLPSPAAVVMRDAVFEQFTRCAPGFQMRESESEKACIRSSRLFRRGAFGSAAAFLWSGDVGYWTNGPVRMPLLCSSIM